MRVGAVLPQIEIGGDVGAVRAFATAVDELGFAHLLAYDHVLGATHEDRDPPLTGPYTEVDPFHDPLVLFAHLAALHPRLEFATGIIIAPQRQTALLARQAADVALLAPGGLRLGLATGWNWTEYDALGQDFRTRGRRLDAQVGLLRELWAGGPVTATLDAERFDRMTLVPAPAPPPSIWIGGFSTPAYRRGARLGDGFIFGGPTEACLAAWAETQALLRAEGRPVAGFGADWNMRGRTPQEVADKADHWRAAGGTHLSVVTLGLGFGRDVDAHVAFLQAVAEATGTGTPD